jgi:hypothetical protein
LRRSFWGGAALVDQDGRGEIAGSAEKTSAEIQIRTLPGGAGEVTDDNPTTNVHPEVNRFFRWSANGAEWSGTLVGAIIGVIWHSSPRGSPTSRDSAEIQVRPLTRATNPTPEGRGACLGLLAALVSPVAATDARRTDCRHALGQSRSTGARRYRRHDHFDLIEV